MIGSGIAARLVIVGTHEKDRAHLSTVAHVDHVMMSSDTLSGGNLNADYGISYVFEQTQTSAGKPIPQQLSIGGWVLFEV